MAAELERREVPQPQGPRREQRDHQPVAVEHRPLTPREILELGLGPLHQTLAKRQQLVAGLEPAALVGVSHPLGFRPQPHQQTPERVGRIAAGIDRAQE